MSTLLSSFSSPSTGRQQLVFISGGQQRQCYVGAGVTIQHVTGHKYEEDVSLDI